MNSNFELLTSQEIDEGGYGHKSVVLKKHYDDGAVNTISFGYSEAKEIAARLSEICDEWESNPGFFVFRKEYLEGVPEDKIGNAAMALSHYAFNGTDPSEDVLENGLWLLIKKNFDQHKREDIIERLEMGE